ncbi:hypothetical protein Lalb_Chr23g0266141 [Lupinus albus]|uniref:Uncharacterized protein n=1 Tax=Lupinus albus TaxID=3870 RepID=A0A6A4N9T8_LUPAL|nr:hypothetical protein Lalb_Chr23g0266141 [Lupinus albus]
MSFHFSIGLFHLLYFRINKVVSVITFGGVYKNSCFSLGSICLLVFEDNNGKNEKVGGLVKPCNFFSTQ